MNNFERNWSRGHVTHYVYFDISFEIVKHVTYHSLSGHQWIINVCFTPCQQRFLWFSCVLTFCKSWRACAVCFILISTMSSSASLRLSKLFFTRSHSCVQDLSWIFLCTNLMQTDMLDLVYLFIQGCERLTSSPVGTRNLCWQGKYFTIACEKTLDT